METNNAKPGDFCWFELATSDQAAAKKFYGGLLGWTANDVPMGPDAFYTMFQLRGRNVGAAYALMPDQLKQGVPPHWGTYVAVASGAARSDGRGHQRLAGEAPQGRRSLGRGRRFLLERADDA